MDPERPLLRLRPTEAGKRITGSRTGGRRPTIPYGVQGDRLAAKIEGIERIFQDDNTDLSVTTDPAAVAPEHALVFEIYGAIGDFAKTAQRIGLEWLAEEVVRLGVTDDLTPYFFGDIDDEDDDDVAEASDPIDVERAVTSFTPALPMEATADELTITGRLYVGMPTKASLTTMLQLWKAFRSGEKAPDKHSDWWDLFSKLKDIRRWGPADRIGDQTLSFISQELEYRPTGPIDFEIDLWFRGNEDQAIASLGALKVAVEDLGGALLDDAYIGEINYHGALIRLPNEAARQLAAMSGELATAEQIMSIRPQSAFQVEPIDPVAGASAPQNRAAPPNIAGRPALAALFDGYPVENHDLLNNRIDITELDVLPAASPVTNRFHGTQMASLILHGDLSLNEPSINRRLQVVPILESPPGSAEKMPAGKLPVAMVFRAVQALKEGAGDDAPIAPHILLINHSVANEAQPFAGVTSPWARTLDYLALRYGVLFIVSAGNIRQPLEVPYYTSINGFTAADAAQREARLLVALERAKGKRGILPPAESVNSLTVGALHRDGAGTMPTSAVDPFPTSGMINLCSGLGLGVADAIKPDVVYDGGRHTAHPTIGFPAGGPLAVHARSSTAVGQLAACPDPIGGRRSLLSRSSGTSNSAALITRAGLQLADALDVAFADEEQPWYERRTAAVLLKALIAHGCSWGRIGGLLERIFPPPDAVRRRHNISRYIGYGRPDVERVMSGTAHRVTLIAEGELAPNKRHEFRFPLPAALSSRKDARRLTMTLAWFSPVRPMSQNYRVVGMELVAPSGKTDYWRGVTPSRLQPPDRPSRKGTLIHRILEGENAVPFVGNSSVVFEVQARSPYSGYGRIKVPYALAVTLEVAPTIGADIYLAIRDALRLRVQPSR